MKISDVYKIINKVNGKFYIGSSVNIKIRWYRHITELLRTVHKNIHLQRAWNKYGRNNFEFKIVEEVPKEKLIELEQKYLDENYGNINCYNLINTVINFHGKNNPFYGKHHTNEVRKVISNKALKRPKIFGRKHSIESIDKIRLNRTGKTCGDKHSQYDHTIYEFKRNDIAFQGTRFDFCKKYNLNESNVCWLIKGKNKSVNGWIIK